MITIGSVSRKEAAARFPFLAENYRGRRTELREFTHRDPDFVFWIYPDGRLHDARDAHRHNVPKGYDHILHDEPDAIVISDNGDLYGTVADVLSRVVEFPEKDGASGLVIGGRTVR